MIRSFLERGIRSGSARLMAGLLAAIFALTPVAPVFGQESVSGPGSVPSAEEPAPSDQKAPPEKPQESAGQPAPEPPSEEVSESKGKEKEEEPEPEAQALGAVGPLTLLRDVSEPKSRLTPDIDNTTGALVYRYEIAVPPGRKDRTPALALVYNSTEATEDSVVGSGWSFDIPYIRRINKDGANYLYSESYFYSSLDGELVSLGNGNYAARDESGDFRKYSLASGVWTVAEKDGTVYMFGSTAAARQDDPADSSRIFKWMLEEARDTNDNFISYEYYKDAGQIYPSKIVYTGNGSTPGVLEVNFETVNRPNAPARFETGFSVKSNYRISEIRTEVADVWARKYVLAYTTGDNGHGSLLDTITESGRDDAGAVTTLPPTDFGYNTSATGWTYDSSLVMPTLFTNGSGADFGMRTADINGDGLVDVLCHNDTTTLSCDRTHPEIYLHSGSGWTDVSGTWLFPPMVDSPTKREGFLDSDGLDSGLRAVDVNGDLKVDLVRGSGSHQYVYLNTGSGWTYNAGWDLPLSLAEGAYDTGARMADINGDGLPDMLCHSDAPSHNPCPDAQIYLNNGSGWVNASDAWSFPVRADNLEKTEVFLGSTGQDNGMRILDINGDGLADLVRAQSSSRYVYINSGSGWMYDPAWSMPVSFLDGSNDTGARLTDINGDGLIDVICHNDLTSGTACNRADPENYLNRGTSSGSGWTNVDSIWAFPPMVNDPSKTETFYTSTGTDSGLRALDVNGDGMDDLVRGASASQRYSYLNNESFPANLLTDITYPEGGGASITYKATPQFKSGSTLLNPSMPIIVHVVSQIVQSDGLAGSETYTYSYEGGEYYFADHLDRRFAGFGKVTRTDAVGNATVSYLHQGNSTDSTNGECEDHASKIGRIYRTEVRDGSGNAYKTTVTKWDRYDLGGGRSFVRRARTTELDFDGDTDHRDRAEEYAYDNTNGNLTGKVEYGEVSASSDGSFTDIGTDKFTTVIAYAANAGAYIVGLPYQETVTEQSSSKVRETRYYYDSLALASVAKGNLTKEERWKTGSVYIDIERAYDGTYGLVKEEKDPRDKTTTYAYDAYNLHVATSMNALSQATGYVYDYSSGRVKQATDPNGRIFQTAYDGLDRVTAERQPDLTMPSTLVTKTAYAYTDTSGAVRVERTDYLDGATSAVTYTYYDGRARPIQARREMEDGNYAVSDTVYNSVGLVEKDSLPYSSGGTARTAATTTAALFTIYDYDPMRRVTSVANAVGTTATLYDDWKTSVTDPRGKIRHFYSDAYWNLARVDELNSGATYTTVYEWDGNGKLTKITDALGNVRNFTYDGLGRRLTAEDLHAPGDSTFGTWTYGYDDAGNLTSTTDPKSQVVSYIYDDLNRVSTEDYTGQSGTEVTYAYDSGTDGVGRLTSVDASGADTSYVYNPLGLVKREMKTIDSTYYQTDYVHDRQGNILEITNPDGSKVKYAYNTAGQLETVQRKESTDASFIDVVTDFDYGPHGKVIHKLFGNGVQSTLTYDSAALYRLANILTTAPGSQSAGTGSREDPTIALADEEAVSQEHPRPVAVVAGNIHSSYDASLGGLGELHKVEDVRQRASAKGAEIALHAQEGIYVRGDLRIEIAGIEPIDGGVMVLARAWAKGGQIGFGVDGTVDVERFMILNPPVLVPDPNGNVVRRVADRRTGESRERRLREDPGEALLQVLEDTITVKRQKFGTAGIIPGKVGHTTSTFYPDPGTGGTAVDGVAQYEDGSSWSTVHDAVTGTYAGSGSSDTDFANASRSPATGKYSLTRSFFLFDTSSIGSGATVMSATLSLRGTSRSNTDFSLNVFSSNPASSSALVSGDYDQVGGTPFATAMLGSSWSTSGYNDFPFNSVGLAAINKTGISKFSLRQSNDYGNSAPGDGNHGVGGYYADRAGTTEDPKLVVEHGAANSAPTAPTALLTEGETDPINVADATPEFSAIYDDPDASDNSVYYRLQVSTSSSFGSVHWDSGKTAMSATSQGSRSPDVSYAGSALEPGVIYYWRIKFWDDSDAEGAWSTATSSFGLSSGKLQDLTYTYDANGNITRIVDASDSDSSKTVDYTYDDLNRLLSATATNVTPGQSTYSYSYSYSAIGNILTRTDVTGAYSYAGDQGSDYANPHAVTSIGSNAFVYDKNGNLATETGGLSNTWDYKDRLTQVVKDGITYIYAYDHEGKRVKLDNGTSVTAYPTKFFNSDRVTLVKHIFAGDELVATVEGTGATAAMFSIHTDHLGGSNIVTSTSGIQKEVLDYFPFGNLRLDHSDGTFNEARKFIGEIYDTGTSLSYLNARYYDGTRGQFLSQDPAFWEVGETETARGILSNPQLQNSYSYAGNSPIGNRDPQGRCLEDLCIVEVAIATSPVWAPEAVAVAAAAYASATLLARSLYARYKQPLYEKYKRVYGNAKRAAHDRRLRWAGTVTIPDLSRYLNISGEGGGPLPSNNNPRFSTLSKLIVANAIIQLLRYLYRGAPDPDDPELPHKLLDSSGLPRTKISDSPSNDAGLLGSDLQTEENSMKSGPGELQVVHKDEYR